jgi:hypothetical protein
MAVGGSYTVKLTAGGCEGLSRAASGATIRAEAATRYRSLASTPQTSADLREIVRTAHEGRVAELFLAEDAERWGTFDPESRWRRLDRRR